jgi:hydroxymethylglutaryl-CoA lyase
VNVRPHAVDLREVGMRDGLQLEEPIPLQKKLVMLDALIATGVRRIEVSSFVSPKAVPALADAAELVSALPADQTVEFTALVAGYGGARRALAAGITSLEYVVSCSDGHSMANARRTSDEAIRAIDDIASLVHASGGLLEVIFAVAWDCPFDGRTPVRRVADAARRAVDLGADRLCLGDTLGTVVPGRARELLDAVREAAPGPQIGVHFHNTRGAGLACVLAAVQAGVTQIDTSVGGLGGCPFAPGASGNIATEEVVYMLEESGIRTGLDLDAALAAAAVVERLIGHELPSKLYRRPCGARLPDLAWTDFPAGIIAE